MAGTPQIAITALPDIKKLSFDFTDSSFFKSGRGLPTPAEVRSLGSGFKTTVKIEKLNMVVKFGKHVLIAEAQAQWMIRKVLDKAVPIPEIYGWRVDEGEVFIYMQLIAGPTLRERWDSLDQSDKVAISDDLRRMITSMRKVKQDTSHPFVGSLDGQRLLDYVLESQPQTAPFASIKAFNDWFSELMWLRASPSIKRPKDPYRPFLPDTGEIVLTHGDLHPGNIIVSTSKPARVVAILDWAYAGWYPDYWEYCKATYTQDYLGEWRARWIHKFLQPRKDECEAFSWYTDAIGAV